MEKITLGIFVVSWENLQKILKLLSIKWKKNRLGDNQGQNKWLKMCLKKCIKCFKDLMPKEKL